jgi:hypothetical protein
MKPKHLVESLKLTYDLEYAREWHAKWWWQPTQMPPRTKCRTSWAALSPDSS